MKRTMMATVLGMMMVAVAPAYAGGFGHHGLKDIQQKAGVDDAPAEKIKQVRKKNQDARKALMGEIRDASQALEALVDRNSQDEAAYQRELDRMAAAHQKLRALRDTEMAEVRGLLKPSQQARVVLGVKEKARERIKERMMEGGGGGLF